MPVEQLAVLVAIVALSTPVVALVALLRANAAGRRLAELTERLRRIERVLHASPAQPTEAPVTAEPQPVVVPLPATAVQPEPQQQTPPPVAEAAPRPADVPPPLPAPVHTVSTPAAGPGLEATVGGRWLGIAGAVALFLGTVFLLKWTIDQGWFGPRARLVASFVFGTSLWLGGLHWRNRYAWLGASLMGAGSCVLYAAAWAGDVLWNLVSPQAAWATMLAVTAGTLLGSHLLRLLPLALIGIGGGFLAPWLVQLEADRPVGLLGWSTVLAVAAAWLRGRHGWGSVLLLAALGTALHAIGWTAVRGTHDTMVQAWAAGFVALVLGAGPLRAVRLVHAVPRLDAAAGAAAAGAWLLLAVLAEDRVAGWVTCTLACALACAFGAAALRHQRALPADDAGREAMWLPAGLLLLASTPFAFEGHGLAIGLGIHAVVLGLLAVSTGSRVLTVLDLLALALAAWVGALDRWDPGMWPRAQMPDWAPWTSSQFLSELLLVALCGVVLRAAAQRGHAVLAAGAGIAGGVLLWQGMAGDWITTLEPYAWPAQPDSLITSIAWALGGVPVVLALGLAGTRGTWSAPGCAVTSGIMLFPTLLAGTEFLDQQLHPSDWLMLYVLMLLPVLAATWSGMRTRTTPPRTWQALLGCPVSWSFALTLLLVGAALHEMAPLPGKLFAAAVVLRGIAFIAVDRSVPWVGLAQCIPVLGALPLATAGLIDLLGAVSPTAATPDQPIAPLPLGLTFVLPPALAAIWLRRTSPSRRAPLWLSGIASVLALVAAKEAELTGWQAPVALVAPCTAACLLLLTIAGPGTLRGSLRAAFSPMSALSAMLVVLSAEAWRRGMPFAENPNFGGHAGLSICWVAVAAAWLSAGFAIRSRVLRVAALLLFLLTSAKLALIDSALLPVPFRILSFLGLGAALMGCGWLYNRFGRQLDGPSDVAPNPGAHP